MSKLTAEQLWNEINSLDWNRDKPLKKVIVASFNEFKDLIKEKTIRDLINELSRAEELWLCQIQYINDPTQVGRDVYHKKLMGEWNWGFTKEKISCIDCLSEIGKIYFLKKYYMNIDEREKKIKQAEAKAKKKAELEEIKRQNYIKTHKKLF